MTVWLECQWEKCKYLSSSAGLRRTQTIRKIQPMKTSTGTLLILPALLAGLGLITAGRATAQNFTNLHSFSATDPVTGTNRDGAHPQAKLISSGNTRSEEHTSELQSL